MSDWPFPDPQNVAVITLKRIINAGYPILYVSHDEDDGVWQFLDSGIVETDDAMLVGLGTIVKHDPSIKEVGDLPLGWSAWRSTPEDSWQRAPKKPPVG